MKELDRFQYQPWYVKLWRYRHYMGIPYSALNMWFHTRNDDDLNFKNCWSIAIGLAQVKMKWYYSWDGKND